MQQLSLPIEKKSRSRVIASSDRFQIELLEQVGEEDYPQLIEISRQLARDYGDKAILTKSTIHKYFNKPGSLPFIARLGDEIIGYIIGVPLEELSNEPWARLDENFNQHNTLYTYAFVIMAQYRGNGYAKMLKRVFLSWAKKRSDIRYLTGHILVGISSRFTGDIRIINRVDNWQGTGKTFEYYRRDLGPAKLEGQRNNPPLAEKV